MLKEKELRDHSIQLLISQKTRLWPRPWMFVQGCSNSTVYNKDEKGNDLNVHQWEVVF